jgi:hypothetical protein
MITNIRELVGEFFNDPILYSIFYGQLAFVLTFVLCMIFKPDYVLKDKTKTVIPNTAILNWNKIVMLSLTIDLGVMLSIALYKYKNTIVEYNGSNEGVEMVKHVNVKNLRDSAIY